MILIILLLKLFKTKMQINQIQLTNLIKIIILLLVMKSYNYNILVFRTVRVTDFGFIIKKIKSKYLNSKITIFTQQQNEELIKLIDGVNEVITYDHEPIMYKKFNNKDFKNNKKD